MILHNYSLPPVVDRSKLFFGDLVEASDYLPLINEVENIAEGIFTSSNYYGIPENMDPHDKHLPQAFKDAFNESPILKKHIRNPIVFYLMRQICVEKHNLLYVPNYQRSVRNDFFSDVFQQIKLGMNKYYLIETGSKRLPNDVYQSIVDKDGKISYYSGDFEHKFHFISSRAQPKDVVSCRELKNKKENVFLSVFARPFLPDYPDGVRYPDFKSRAHMHGRDFLNVFSARGYIREAIVKEMIVVNQNSVETFPFEVGKDFAESEEKYKKYRKEKIEAEFGQNLIKIEEVKKSLKSLKDEGKDENFYKKYLDELYILGLAYLDRQLELGCMGRHEYDLLSMSYYASLYGFVAEHVLEMKTSSLPKDILGADKSLKEKLEIIMAIPEYLLARKITGYEYVIGKDVIESIKKIKTNMEQDPLFGKALQDSLNKKTNRETKKEDAKGLIIKGIFDGFNGIRESHRLGIIQEITDTIVAGRGDRLIEVMQNVVEKKETGLVASILNDDNNFRMRVKQCKERGYKIDPQYSDFDNDFGKPLLDVGDPKSILRKQLMHFSAFLYDKACVALGSKKIDEVLPDQKEKLEEYQQLKKERRVIYAIRVIELIAVVVLAFLGLAAIVAATSLAIVTAQYWLIAVGIVVAGGLVFGAVIFDRIAALPKRLQDKDEEITKLETNYPYLSFIRDNPQVAATLNRIIGEENSPKIDVENLSDLDALKKATELYKDMTNLLFFVENQGNTKESVSLETSEPKQTSDPEKKDTKEPVLPNSMEIIEKEIDELENIPNLPDVDKKALTALKGEISSLGKKQVWHESRIESKDNLCKGKI